MTTARILLVDDETLSSELVRRMLSNIGYNVCAVANNGNEALEKAVELSPDLILMDIGLRGGMTGIAAAEKIQKVVDTPIVYLTAFTDEATIESAKMTQPFGYIVKPFSVGKLRSAIEIALYRHKMERQLKERERSYHVLAENLPGIIYRQQLVDGRVDFFNDMVSVITGYAPEELPPGKIGGIGGLVVEEDRTKVVETVTQAVAVNLPFQSEYRIRHKNGQILHVSEHGRATCDKSGVPSHVEGMIFDITERMLTEEKLTTAYRTLEERKTFFQSIINNIESGILVTDLNLRIVLSNPHACAFFNKTMEEVDDRCLRDICPEIADRIDGGIDSDEITINTSTQEQQVIGFSRFSQRGADRAVIGHIINFKDLTEFVAIRREMLLKERLSAMGELVARVAHEMRNPLFGMTAVGQILAMELQLNPEQKKLIDSFQKEARRLNTLVEDLLECTRELRIRRETVNFLKIIEASIQVNEIFAREKKIEFITGAPFQDLWIWADPDKLEQVLVNLLKNAIDATVPGGAILLSLTADDKNVRFKVDDEGHGISEALAEKIFEVFYTTKKNGTGMGLAISRNIAEAHGGSLTACNNEHGGATFTVTLPLHEKRL
ncbi:MAG: response regulator [Desulfuromonadales bacterium]|nr:response regulator [Desulfuromonadales bacterium]